MTTSRSKPAPAACTHADHADMKTSRVRFVRETVAGWYDAAESMLYAHCNHCGSTLGISLAISTEERT